MYNLTIKEKTMKRIFVAIAALGLAATVATAQDFNAAVDAFNAGAQALETNKTEALAQFRTALTEASACEGEEATDLVAKCKEIIPNTLLSIAKEQINEATYSGTYAERQYSETLITNMLIYEITVTGLAEKPTFTFSGETETRGFAINVAKLPLNADTTFRAECVMRLK